MKILDRYILKTFLITFTSVFVILFFIFILQTVWLFIAELAGKDLDFLLVLKFLLFSMPGVIPLVLPLSILLASIMTFGDLSENYEFAAMKSSGVSLQRAIKGLTIFILVLSLAAFAFANNVIPYSQYKFINFRKNIAQVKPAMAIAEGQFSEVGDYNIKVDKKSGDKGNILTGVTIHKKSSVGSGNSTVIKAKSGILLSSEKSNILQLVLYKGAQYEDIVSKDYQAMNKLPFAKTTFEKYIMNMDLSQMNKVDVNDEKVASTNTMLNINELSYTLDSLNKSFKKDVISFSENIRQRATMNMAPAIEFNPKPDSLKAKTKRANIKDLLRYYTTEEKAKIAEIAQSTISGTYYTITSTKEDLKMKQKNINSHLIVFYEKFVIAYACVLMFFIGAPLGAIIRKGGLGLPIVFAVLIFITFHFINTFGKKLAQENGIPPFVGAWLSSMILTPLAVLLTYRATNDIGLINMDIILSPFQKVFNKVFPKK